MSAGRYIQGAAALGVAVLALAACDNLKTQPRPKGWRPPAEAQSDKRIWPPRPPAHTVAQEDAPQPPPALTPALLQRGHQRFDIYCAPCHGYVGDAHGMIVQRGFPAPPSFHIDRLRAAPTQHFYDVITSGWGAMYSYADRVVPADRWAIAAYIRALQESQNAPVASLSDAQRKELK
jgi:mono/diheme cytochrome c family protein